MNYLMANFLLRTKATIELPTNVAVQYNQRLAIFPDNRAGAKERAGFIDAPEIKDKKKISSPTIPPMAMPPRPFNPLV